MSKNTDQKYGPHTAEVEAILNHIKTLTSDEVEALAHAWDAAWFMTRDTILAVIVRAHISDTDYQALV
ncbi:MAG: hypothetical protein ACYCU8_07480 [Ferrimicrobium acidiphilum]